MANHEMNRIQELLAAKKLELPSNDYFSGFVAEFHRRQRASLLKARPILEVWFEYLSDLVTFEPAKAFRYATSVAAVFIFSAIGLIQLGEQEGGSLAQERTTPSYYVAAEAEASLVSQVREQRVDEVLAANTRATKVQYVLNETPAIADTVVAF